jgi:hypothetical protein
MINDLSVRAETAHDDDYVARRSRAYDTWNATVYASYGEDYSTYKVAFVAAGAAWYGAIARDYAATDAADFDAASSEAWEAAIKAVDAKKTKEACLSPS